MAVKTITIDLEAYDRLARLKRKGQSFSQVIKEHVPEKAGTGRDLLLALEGGRAAEDFLDAVDRLVRERKKSPFRAPRL
jgi:predicted CopG family antitoxin